MKTIRLPLPTDTGEGNAIVQHAIVNWFPPLTDDQHVQNSAALAAGFSAPHEEPNLIEIVWVR